MNGYSMRMTCLMAGVAGLLVLTGCSTAPHSEEGKTKIEDKAATALAKSQTSDPTLVGVYNAVPGYAVFPTVGKGAAGIGGAYGKGVLFERGIAVGYCDLTQATIGLQLGGQGYTEILCFETGEAVELFKQGRTRFDAQASAVAIKSGTGANAKFSDGVAVYTMGEAGLMYEASVGGQKFSYQPK